LEARDPKDIIVLPPAHPISRPRLAQVFPWRLEHEPRSGPYRRTRAASGPGGGGGARRAVLLLSGPAAADDPTPPRPATAGARRPGGWSGGRLHLHGREAARVRGPGGDPVLRLAPVGRRRAAPARAPAPPGCRDARRDSRDLAAPRTVPRSQLRLAGGPTSRADHLGQ